MSDDDKLAAPSFETMDAGVTLRAAGYAFDYTDIVIGPDGEPALQPEPLEAAAPQVLVFSAISPAGTARQRRSLEWRFAAPVLAGAPRLARGGWVPVELAAAAPAEAPAITWIEARALAPDRRRSVLPRRRTGWRWRE